MRRQLLLFALVTVVIGTFAVLASVATDQPRAIAAEGRGFVRRVQDLEKKLAQYERAAGIDDQGNVNCTGKLTVQGELIPHFESGTCHL